MYYGQFSNPSVDEYLHKTFFLDKKEGMFIEAGAYDGIADSSCLFFEREMNWGGFNIEPNITLFKELEMNRPNSINIHGALINSTSENTMFTFEEYLFLDKHKPIGHGYIKEITPEINQKEAKQDNNCKGGTYSVPGISLEELAITYDLGIKDIDLLVLDIEGGELEILKDIGILIPSVICVEDNKNEVYKFKEILEPKGYIFHSRMNVNNYFILG